MRLKGNFWLPTLVLAGGGLLLTGVQQQLTPELQAPLADALPATVGSRTGVDVAISDIEAEVAGFTDYALRLYGAEAAVDGGPSSAPAWASVYLGFYDRQTRGRTIHSPKNCLPGAGWQALSSRPETLARGDESITVNRYVLQNGDEQALVLYWYQGRGRVAHNEYLVKWDLLRDAALLRRTDEALVRIVVPISQSEEVAFDLARKIALDLKGSLDGVLPL